MNVPDGKRALGPEASSPCHVPLGSKLFDVHGRSEADPVASAGVGAHHLLQRPFDFAIASTSGTSGHHLLAGLSLRRAEPAQADGASPLNAIPYLWPSPIGQCVPRDQAAKRLHGRLPLCRSVRSFAHYGFCHGAAPPATPFRLGALSPSLSSRRTASDREISLAPAHFSIASITACGTRAVRNGVRPVAGRPRCFCGTLIDLRMFYV
jgi:hypothetical protein